VIRNVSFCYLWQSIFSADLFVRLCVAVLGVTVVELRKLLAYMETLPVLEIKMLHAQNRNNTSFITLILSECMASVLRSQKLETLMFQLC
jgi:hypothetical protein